MVAAALALAACDPPHLRIVNRSDSPIVVGQDAMVEALANDAARWWGGSPEDLGGWTLLLVDEPLDAVCERPACAVLRDQRIYIDCRVLSDVPETGRSTLRFLVRHEIGHAILLARRFDADGAHHDPRWSLPTP